MIQKNCYHNPEEHQHFNEKVNMQDVQKKPKKNFSKGQGESRVTDTKKDIFQEK